MLNFQTHEPTGQATAPPLLIAHGLFGSARNWGVIAKRMTARRRVTCVDMRNHASSLWSDDMSYGAMASDLSEICEAYGPVDLLGHSMGGKAAMVAALDGANIRRLIVADIAPVIYTHTQTPLIDAMESLDLSAVQTRSDADAALTDKIEDPTVRAFLLQSLDMKTKTWRLNLSALRENMDQIIGFPDIEATSDLPALFLSGAASDYVQPDARPRVKALFPNAKFAKIPGAGHWLHAEKPREFEAAITAYLEAS